MAEIKTTEGSLYFYTHWGGSELPDAARAAAEFASPRLGDEPCWTRAILDQLIKASGSRDQEIGSGIMLKPDAEDEYNGDKPSVIIDGTTGDVQVREKW